MFEDRRHGPRYPKLIRTVISAGRERYDVVCTDTSPTGAFFTTRHPPPVGTPVIVDMRAGGVDSPIVELHGTVTRTTLVGSPGPSGFGVAWQLAQCERGPEPLFRVLRQLLHVAVLGEADLTQGRSAQYVFPTAPEPGGDAPTDLTPRSTPSSPSTRPSSVRQALGVWSSPVHRVTGGQSREFQGPDTVRQPAQHPVELEPPPRAVQSDTPKAQPAAPIPQPPSKGHAHPASSGVHGDRSELFDGLREGPSMAVGRHAETSAQSGDNASQSWPVYALAPGERRQVTDPQVSAPPPVARQSAIVAPTARHGSGAIAGEAVTSRGPPPVAPKHGAVVATTPVPSSQPFSSLAERTESAEIQPAAPVQRRKQDGARMLAAADIPVTFLRQNQLVPGHLTGIAEQLACIVTQAPPPDLDEVLVIHLPVRFEDAWRTVQLTGKLLQVPTDTPAGKRFVMHIERVDDGRHKGAFQAFLQALSGP